MLATNVLEARAPHLSLFLKEYWFREVYLDLKVTVSFSRSESYTRVTDVQVRMHHSKVHTAEPPSYLEPPVHHRFCACVDGSSHRRPSAGTACALTYSLLPRQGTCCWSDLPN